MSGQLESTVRALEQERDRYKQECELLRSSRTLTASPSRHGSIKHKVFLHFVMDTWCSMGRMFCSFLCSYSHLLYYWSCPCI